MTKQQILDWLQSKRIDPEPQCPDFDGGYDSAIEDVITYIQSLPDEPSAEHAVHDAITRALAEAGVKQDVLVGMCIEVGLGAYRDALRTSDE